MRKAIALAVLILGLALTLAAQSAGTDNYIGSNPNGPCNIRPPENAPTRSWYCFAGVVDDEQTGDVSTVTLYVTVNPDNTFTNGLLSKSPLYGSADSFTSSNYSGTFTPDPTYIANGTFTGTFSGTTTNGVPFTGQHTETIGLGKCRAGRYTVYPCNGRVSFVFGSVTFTPQ